MTRLTRRGTLTTIAGAVGASTIGWRTAAAQSGDREWTHETGGLAFEPTVVDGTVYYVDAQTRDNEDSLVCYALDAASGSTRWERTVGVSDDQEAAGGFLAPIVIDGIVFVSDRALDAATGETLWTLDFGQSYHLTPAFGDGRVYWSDGDVRAFDPETGEQLWSDGTDETVGFPLYADGGLYAVGEQGSVVSLDPATGTERWRTSTETQSNAPPIVADGRLFVGTRDDFFALEAGTGEELWALGERAGSLWPATATGDTVLVNTPTRRLRALDAASGEERWRYPAGDSVGEPYAGFGAPSVVGDRVVCRQLDDDGAIGIDALDIATGERVWRHDYDTDFDWQNTPRVVDGTLYASVGNDLAALPYDGDGSSDGALSWLGTIGHHDEWQHGNMSIGGPSIQNLRLVQTVENTRVFDGDSDRYYHDTVASERLLNSFANESVLDTPADPGLVLGRTTAPVFDLRVEPEDVTEPVEVTGRFTGDDGHEVERTAEIQPSAVRGEHTERMDTVKFGYPEYEFPEQLPLLEALVPESDRPEEETALGVDGDYPLFPLDSPGTFELEVSSPDFEETFTDSVEVDAPATTRSVTVGLTEVHVRVTASSNEPDGSIDEFADALGWELLEQLPVSEVTVAIASMPAELLTSRLGTDQAAVTDIERHVHRHLEDADVLTFTSDDGRETGGTVSGVDFAFGAVPHDFAEVMGLSRAASDVDGATQGAMPYMGDRPWANACWVNMGMEKVAVHEYGHYLLGNTAFEDLALPASHSGAKHTTDNVQSTAFRIQDGEFGVGSGRPAIMAAGGGRWISSTSYRDLVDSDVQPPSVPLGEAINETIGGMARSIQTDPIYEYVVEGSADAIHSGIERVASVDLDDVGGWYEGAKSGLDDAVDGVEFPWQAPELPIEHEWPEFDGVLADRREIADALRASNEVFELADGTEIPSYRLGERIATANERHEELLGGVQDWAGQQREDAIDWSMHVAADAREGDLDVATDKVATIDDRIHDGIDVDGDGEVTLKDGEGAVVGTYEAGKEVVVGQDGASTVEGSYLAVVPLPEEVAEVEISVENEDGEPESTSIDPTVHPVRSRVQRLPDDAFESPEDRQRVLDALEQVSTDGGDGQATGDDATTLEDLYLLLDEALDGDYDQGSVTRESLLARTEGELQRRGQEAPDLPEGDDGVPATWIAAGAIGALGAGGYALRDRWNSGSDGEETDAASESGD